MIKNNTPSKVYNQAVILFYKIYVTVNWSLYAYYCDKYSYSVKYYAELTAVRNKINRLSSMGGQGLSCWDLSPLRCFFSSNQMGTAWEKLSHAVAVMQRKTVRYWGYSHEIKIHLLKEACYWGGSRPIEVRLLEQMCYRGLFICTYEMAKKVLSMF